MKHVEMNQTAELNVRIAITKTYRYLFYPTSDAPKDHAFLRRETVPPQGQGDTNIDQTNVVVRVLHNLQKVRTSDDNPLPDAYLKAKAWDKNQIEMTTEDLRRAFARKVSLPLLLDVNQLQRTLENGVKTRQWVYYDTGEDWAYDQDSPPTFWQISDHTRLYTPTEAECLNLRIKGKWPLPQPPAGEGGATVLVTWTMNHRMIYWIRFWATAVPSAWKAPGHRRKPSSKCGISVKNTTPLLCAAPPAIGFLWFQQEPCG